MGSENLNAKSKVNTVVTATHICVAFAFAISQIMFIFTRSGTRGFRILTTFYLIGGLADLILSLMLWFILDNHKETVILLD